MSFEIKDLTFNYPLSENNALNHIDLTIKAGEFAAICGRSGSGKSTLLKHFKTVLTPHGKRSGQIFFEGKILSEVDFRTQSSAIGYVLQNPDNQIVTDKVWHELAFGLESLGADNKTIRLRVAEMASYFGIQNWFDKKVTELSGGQKQLLNLASIMAMQPSVLILDEPTSQLDPIAASDFLETVRKINRELGTTILITEHRLEDVFPSADRAIVMDDGKIIAEGKPEKVGEMLKQTHHAMFSAMPAPMQIYAAVENELSCPITVRDGRNWLSDLFSDKKLDFTLIDEGHETRFFDEVKKSDLALECRDTWFRYDKESPDVITGLNLKVPRGSFYAIVGGNGTGKSTMLTLFSSINKPYRGKIIVDGKEMDKYKGNELFTHKLAMLPQDPQSLFVKKSVGSDLYDMLRDSKLGDEEKYKKVQTVAELTEIESLLEMHPYDISGGEQQRAALAKVLLLEPKILLLDEPTKGIDNDFKLKLACILKSLTSNGVTVLMVSHDVEFCACHAEICSMFFNGSIVTTDSPNRFFSGNSFYTTAANRMSRHLFENAVTNEDVISLCRQNLKNYAPTSAFNQPKAFSNQVLLNSEATV